MDGQFVTLAVCILLFIGLFKTLAGKPFSQGSTCDQLLALHQMQLLYTAKPKIPAAIRRRKRGCRAQVLDNEKTV